MMQRMRLTDDACVQVQSDVGNVAKKAKNVASDLSDLPNPFKGGPGSTDPQTLAKDAKNAVPHLIFSGHRLC